MGLKTHPHSLPLLLHPLQSQCLPLRSLSPRLQGLRELRKTHPLPYPHQHTNAQMHASSTSNHIFLLIRSENTREIAVLFPINVILSLAAPKSSSSNTAGGLSFNPTLKPVGHHSTNETFLFVFNHCTHAFAFFALAVPR